MFLKSKIWKLIRKNKYEVWNLYTTDILYLLLACDHYILAPCIW